MEDDQSLSEQTELSFQEKSDSLSSSMLVLFGFFSFLKVLQQCQPLICISKILEGPLLFHSSMPICLPLGR